MAEPGFQKGHIFYKGGEKGWFKKGQTPWIKGRTHSKKTREILSKLNKGKSLSEETKRRISENNAKWLLGKTHTEEARKKIADAGRGRKPWNKNLLMPSETKIKISLTKKGSIPWNKGKKGIYSKEYRQKLSEVNRGNKSNLWQGGKSFEPYTIDWTKTLRESIRERDKYVCQICNIKQSDSIHSIHHINYDKKNCNPDNLITLCKKCHMKTNFNRDSWITKFKKIGGDINDSNS